ncbi:MULTISPECIES: hypothetical protein [unclassified Microbacterium]|uniref:hypothetical protein n=1 Tax=unclassified Microbacterium TaxID=2609290 RepID=UPI001650D0DF|nr:MULTISPECIES: hypothetical protein [unclassified Microbacterium]MBC6496238.1 hypothetical protein [Microbacterium sp. 4-7]
MAVAGGAFYEVDTDVLRAMASKARRIVGELGSSDAAKPADAGHEWVVAAATRFSSAWSDGLCVRVADTEDFADRLSTTARIFDEGTDAAKVEVDAMIWDD